MYNMLKFCHLLLHWLWILTKHKLTGQSRVARGKVIINDVAVLIEVASHHITAHWFIALAHVNAQIWQNWRWRMPSGDTLCWIYFLIFQMTDSKREGGRKKEVWSVGSRAQWCVSRLFDLYLSGTQHPSGRAGVNSVRHHHSLMGAK